MKRRVRIALALFPVIAVPGFFILSLLFPLPPLKRYSPVIEDRHHTLLQAFLADDDTWRIKTSPEEIPPKLKRLLLEKEDRYFPWHFGINPVSVLRAAAQNIAAGEKVSGASTITMQVARLLEPKERTLPNKVAEAFRAVQLELRYSKKEILEIYCSMIPLGGNIEGLNSAALLYYQTPLERLNIARLIDLIIIPNNPNALRPDKHPEALYKERLRVSAPWIRAGLLSTEDSLVIAETPAAAQRMALPRHAQHFCLRVRDMYPDDASVVTTLDLGTQETVERLVLHHMRTWTPMGVLNAAVFVLRRHEVVAYVGSGDFDDAGAMGQVDAVKALRSPGSTLKPLLCALAMDQGILTPKTLLLDTPYDAEGFLAENYDGTYSGMVSAEDALRRSLNVPMVRLLNRVGTSPFLDVLHQAGVASLEEQRSRLGLSLILGGCGTTLEELTSAFSCFPASGVFVRPAYTMDLPPHDSVTVFSPAAAYMVTDILSGVNRPDLPNNFESSRNLPLVAFKTGTSYGRRDAWSIGYSSEFTIGVWLGNVDNRGNPELAGSKAAAPLLIDIFNSLSTLHEKAILPKPRDLGVREVCALSGQLATPRCAAVVDDFYSRAHTLPTPCQLHREYMLSPDRRTTYCASCVGDHPYVTATFTDYPPELRTYWDNIGHAYTSLPPHNPRCAQLRVAEGPEIVSPSDEMTYYLFSRSQKLVLQASSTVDVREQMWYIDERFLGRYHAGKKVFVGFEGGTHTISCLDDKGNISAVTIEVRYAL
jgi:penicillin-binding protein 1C